MGDREQSGQTMHTNRSQLHGKSHVSHVENEKDMQREIDELKKKLRRARRRRSSLDRKSTRLNSSHAIPSRMPSSA